MNEAQAINKVRSQMRAKEAAFIQGQVEAGRELRLKAAAAGQEQGQEARQAQQQQASQRVAAKREEAQAQGMGA